MADTKLSALTELAAAPAATDEFYINDGGTSKRITAANMLSAKHTIWVPAAAMTPSATAGCAPFATFETTAGQPDIQYLAFDTTTEEHAQFSVAFPKSWNLGTITFQPFWSRIAAPTAGLDGVAWGLQGLAVPDDASIDQAYGTEVVVGLDAAKSTEDLWVAAESGAVTITGTPADDDLCFLQVSRVVASSSPLDDLDVDACLIGIKLFYTTDTGTDA